MPIIAIFIAPGVPLPLVAGGGYIADMIKLDQFRSSVSAASPPSDAGPALQALWWALKGDWDRAHKCVQQDEADKNCDWVHAHLHRQEGDMNNAGGWYRRAGRPVATCSLQEEWDQVATALLHQA